MRGGHSSTGIGKVDPDTAKREGLSGDEYLINFRGVIQLCLVGEQIQVTRPLKKLILALSDFFAKGWLVGHLDQPIAPNVDGQGLVIEVFASFLLGTLKLAHAGAEIAIQDAFEAASAGCTKLLTMMAAKTAGR
jgi:hypothetical protein